MKYFFLSDGWTTGRIWEFGGLWNEQAWNRKPFLQRQSLYIQENGENLWLYKTEEAVLMVEVMPKAIANPNIGQVVLKRLLSADQVVERLCTEPVFHPADESSSFKLTQIQPDRTQAASTAKRWEQDVPAVTEASSSVSYDDFLMTDMPGWQKRNQAASNPSVMTRLRQLAKRAVASSSSATVTVER